MNKTTLLEFIQQKKYELLNSGIYRSVEFVSAEDCTIEKYDGGYGVGTAFTTKKSQLDKAVNATSVNELEIGKYLGSSIDFKCVQKGKRKERGMSVDVAYAEQPAVVTDDMIISGGAIGGESA